MVNNSSNCMMLDEAFYGDQVVKVENHANTMNFMKRPMTLELNDCNLNSSKRLKPTSILSTPDFCKLDLSGPELERLYLTNQKAMNLVSTPTPSLLSKSFVPEDLEAEMYVKPFFEAFKNMQNCDSNSSFQVERPLTSSGSNSSEYVPVPQFSELISSNDFSNAIHPQIKEEPRLVPSVTSSPPMSPIDMENQEKIKLDRKRQRNRLAASKCRKRKLERISKLEQKVKELKSENFELSAELSRLMENVFKLKQSAVSHMNNGCKFPDNYQIGCKFSDNYL